MLNSSKPFPLVVVPVVLASGSTTLVYIHLRSLTTLEILLQVFEELVSLVASIACCGMVVPIAYHEEAEKHSTKMCHVCDVVSRRAKGGEKLNGNVEHNEPLCLNGNGKWEDEDE